MITLVKTTQYRKVHGDGDRGGGGSPFNCLLCGEKLKRLSSLELHLAKVGVGIVNLAPFFEDAFSYRVLFLRILICYTLINFNELLGLLILSLFFMT